MLDGRAEDFILPVRTLSEQRRICIVGAGCELADIYAVIEISSEFPEVQHIDAAGLLGNCEHAVV